MPEEVGDKMTFVVMMQKLAMASTIPGLGGLSGFS
jgi:hypothetical protein